MQFSSALPVGASSQGEWYDLYLRELVDVDEAFAMTKDINDYEYEVAGILGTRCE